MNRQKSLSLIGERFSFMQARQEIFLHYRRKKWYICLPHFVMVILCFAENMKGTLSMMLLALETRGIPTSVGLPLIFF